MLCNTVEEGEEKCYQYWPLQKDEYVEFGKLKVTLESEYVHEQYVIRRLHICNEKVCHNYSLYLGHSISNHPNF